MRMTFLTFMMGYFRKTCVTEEARVELPLCSGKSAVTPTNNSSAVNLCRPIAAQQGCKEPSDWSTCRLGSQWTCTVGTV